MDEVGYEYLRLQLGLSSFPVERPARVRPVNRVLLSPGEGLQVPKSVAPKTDDPVEHLLFALKHEGINLQVLAGCMPHVSGAGLMERLRAAPSSLFLRKACYLWEWFSGQELVDLPVIAGAYADLFPEEDYVTGRSLKIPKWRINFNGLGSAEYCPTVRRTPAIVRGMSGDILSRTNAFLESLGAANADRALSWAYLSETDSSFAIERETPTQNKAETFVALLQQAHENTELTEDYLADLQSSTVTNPFEKAASFRHEQNWLRGGGLRGAAGVTYVPPDPALLHRLMPAFLTMANSLPANTDPVVAASVASFGFVFLHPFMDGNGRLSRFLFHHALCRSGRLGRGLLLPVSIAMKRNETAYLAALQSFSRPARRLWDVSWLDEDRFSFSFKGAPSVYQYWDATSCAEFGFSMAEQALEVDLRQETDFLARFDRMAKAVNREYDLRSNDLHLLIVSALQNGGTISRNRRKQLALRVQVEAFEFIESLARLELSAPNETSQSDQDESP